MRFVIRKKINIVVFIFMLMICYFIQGDTAEAKTKDCIINNGTLVSYCGDSEVYKVPKNVRKISFGAFEKATKLKKVIIGGNVKSISKGFIRGNKSIKTIVVSKKNKKYSSYKGLLYNKSGKKMLVCPAARKNVIIHDKCVSIDEIAGENVETITIGKNVKKYTSESEQMIGLTPKLKSIKVKKENKVFFVQDGVLFMRMYDDSVKLIKYPSAVPTDKYVIPNNVSTVMFYAFAHSSIKNLVISENVTTMLSPMYNSNIEIITIKGMCASEAELALPEGAWNPMQFWRSLSFGGYDEVTTGNLKKYIFENDNAVIPSSETYWIPEHVIIWSRANSTTHRYAVENNLQWCEIR